MAKTDKIALAKEIWRLRGRTRKLYSKMDELFEQLRGAAAVGEVLEIGPGVELHIIDNFKKTNVCYKPAGVRRFELVEVKKKRERCSASA